MSDNLFRVTYYMRHENIVRVAFHSQDTFTGTDFNSRKEVRRVVAATENVPASCIDVSLFPAQPIIPEDGGYRIVWDVCIIIPALA